MDIQKLLELGLPFFAALISFGIQQAHWEARINTAIAGISVIIAAFASLFFQGKLTGNVYGDALMVLGAAIAIQAGPLLPLQRYLVANFPVASKAQPAIPVVPAPTPAPVPPEAQLPIK